MVSLLKEIGFPPQFFFENIPETFSFLFLSFPVVMAFCATWDKNISRILSAIKKPSLLNLVKMSSVPELIYRLKLSPVLKLIYRFDAVPIKILTGFFFHRNWQLILKFTWKCKGLRMTNTLMKKNKMWRPFPSNIKTLKSYGDRESVVSVVVLQE